MNFPNIPYKISPINKREKVINTIHLYPLYYLKSKIDIILFIVEK